MSQTTTINYTDSDGTGTITLIANHLLKGSKYYAKFDRNTVNINNLIARIQKKEIGTNAIMTKHTVSLLKAEILEALSRGESINLLDLGTLYIKADVEIKGNDTESADIMGFKVKFTPSKITKEAVSKIEIKKIVIANKNPIINTITDLYTGEETRVFDPKAVIRLEGKRLKITGDEGGIFFAQSTNEGKPASDNTIWIKAERIIRNENSTVEFFLPPALTAETPYCIVLKTKGNTAKKSYFVTHSDVVFVSIHNSI